MRINFEKIKFKNILSYGNKFTEFNFKNGIDIITAKNGNGKSTLIDALCYALYGKPFRKIKIGNLINDKNDKNLEVQLYFNINDKKYKVIRGLKPSKFEIYYYDNKYKLFDKLYSIKDQQNKLQNIIGISENVFRQLIALGANLNSSRNFMDLNTKEKEEIFQIITDTTLFIKIQEKINLRKNKLKTSKVEYEYKINLLSSNIDSISRNIVAMEEQNQKIKNDKKNILQNIKKQINEKEEKIKQYNIIKKLKNAKIKYQNLSLKIKDLEIVLNELKDKLSHHKANLEVYEKNKDEKIKCNICGNIIKIKKTNINPLEEKQKIKDLEIQINNINNQLISEKQKKDKLKEFLLNSKKIIENKEILKNEINNLKNELKKIQEWKEIEINYNELNQLKQELKQAKDKYLEIKQNLTNLLKLEEIISEKNLKGYILSLQIPLLNKYINEFLELFSTEFNFIINEDFKEKIISRAEDKEFNALSNGQKQRITFSILFSFLKLIEEKNGVSTNLLILDEYLDSSLDFEGISEVLKIIYEKFRPTKNIILISHNNEIKNSEFISRKFIVQKDIFSKLKEVEVQ